MESAPHPAGKCRCSGSHRWRSRLQTAAWGSGCVSTYPARHSRGADRGAVRPADHATTEQFVPLELLKALVGSRELVLGTDLPGNPQAGALDVLVLDAGRAIRIKRTRDDTIGALIAEGRKKPQLVL